MFSVNDGFSISSFFFHFNCFVRFIYHSLENGSRIMKAIVFTILCLNAKQQQKKKKDGSSCYLFCFLSFSFPHSFLNLPCSNLNNSRDIESFEVLLLLIHSQHNAGIPFKRKKIKKFTIYCHGYM